LRYGRELGLLVRVEDHGGGEALFQFGGVLALVRRLVGEFVEALLAGGAVNSVKDPRGFAVESLSADLALVSQSGDVAIAAEENSAGTGEETLCG
jgi:hypothetical protein